MQSFLIDLHERCHRSFCGFLEHARALTPEQLDQSLDGFGYDTVREQFQHAIGAERYWASMLRDAMDASEDAADAASIDALEAFRKRVFDTTDAWLREQTNASLEAARSMTVYGGAQRDLVPIHIFTHTQTHLFHHINQITTIYHLLKHPISKKLDLPIV